MQGVQLELPEPAQMVSWAFSSLLWSKAVAVVGSGGLGSVAEWRPAEVRTWLAALGLEEAPERAMAPCLTGEQLLQALNSF